MIIKQQTGLHAHQFQLQAVRTFSALWGTHKLMDPQNLIKIIDKLSFLITRS